MGERKSYKELEQIKKKYNCSTLWSYSRYNTYKNCPFEYMLKYIKKVKPDRDDGIYGILGGIAYEIIEMYMNKEIKYEDMLSRYEESWIKLQLAGYKFDRSDENKNTAIANKYEECMKHFFKHHIPIEGKTKLEEFVIISVKPFTFIGYIDILFKEGDNYIVGDFKTSTIYSGSKVLENAKQLLLYSEALIQAGIPIENIKPRWNFLKYVTIETQLANGKTNSRNIERNQIGNKLSSNVKMWLNKSGCTEDEIENYLATMNLTNSIEHLPYEVRSKYIIKDCWVSIELTQEIIDELKKDIVETLIEIIKKEMAWQESKDDSIWWQEVTDKNSYYFSNLCGYSASIHLPYKKYLEDRKEKDGNYTNHNKEDENDLSWLNEIM